MIQDSKIAPHHSAILEKVQRPDRGMNERQMVSLYRQAAAIFSNPEFQQETRGGYLLLRVVTKAGHIIARATHEGSGVYVQLAGEVTKPMEAQLSIGLFLAAESTSSTGPSVRIWP